MTDREKTVLPELDVTDEDRQRAKSYVRARFGSAVVTEAFTFEDGIRSAYHDEILSVCREKAEQNCRERHLISALKRILELESQLKEKPVI